MWRTCTAAAAATWWVCSLVTETARADEEVGVLTCTLAEAGSAPASDIPTAGQTRDALCTFKAKGGAEETYAGKVQGVSISPEHKGALIWVVKSTSGAAAEPGLLQQTYASDPAKPADQKPPMIGEANSDIILHSMADKLEGSASASQKAAPAGFVILGVELRLTATSG